MREQIVVEGNPLVVLRLALLFALIAGAEAPVAAAGSGCASGWLVPTAPDVAINIGAAWRARAQDLGCTLAATPFQILARVMGLGLDPAAVRQLGIDQVQMYQMFHPTLSYRQ